MKIAILATGDEIVYGDTLNTNGYQLAHALNSEGLTVGLHMSCTDEENEIYSSIAYLAAQHQVILITGGLGPTSDDRTRYALSRFINQPLVEFPEAIEHIQNRLLRTTMSLTEGNRQQAKFPADAVLLPNPNGTAMGCYYWHQEHLYILLPGPPRECMPMFNNHVLPIVQKLQHDSTQVLKWRVFGVAEAQISQQLDDALKDINCVTGYRLETPYVECKVRCQADLLNTITAIVAPLLAPHIIASVEQKASEKLAEALAAWHQSVLIQDNATGGLLQTLIQKPANYSVLSFTTHANPDFAFRIDGLQEYWSGQQHGGDTTITITYHLQGEEKQESHTFPYRSVMVVHYAAEWLCYRIYELINASRSGAA
ncbi:competence/damage-inducible protein A [Legionella dresdenensis]|uniref:Competence/damage-inducible protein A n=1 Tax=Legionella dresdenensis TaxID=450200 RepID=A0ABV8CHQ4_9GAMM